jgi:parallel beta-helix repeat protein
LEQTKGVNMRKVVFVVVFAVLLFTTQVAAASKVVSLSAADVTSAQAIEQAISEATDQGAHPGEVILDGGQGPFTYSDLDRTINISQSGVTLRGVNGATITNCDDGILLEGADTGNVLIQGIAFHCLNSGILAIGDNPQAVAIRNNSIDAAGFGVQVTGGDDWSVTGNIIHAGVDAINLSGTTHVLISANQLSGYEIAVFLDHAGENMVDGNQIQSNWQGILLTYGASANRIMGNTISGPRDSGISLEGGNVDDKIHGNLVTCADGYACVAVSGPLEGNKVSGNNVQ